MESPPPPIPSHQGRGNAPRNLPYFSRSQLGVILLLGAVLIGLYAWRTHWLYAPSPSRKILVLTFVEVTGPAAHPGVYSFTQPPTLGEVWQRTGAPGVAPEPDKKIASGSRIEVKPEGGYRLTAMSGTRLLTLGLPIDLNQASAEDLEALPGIGPALAKGIIDYRQEHGLFKNIEELGGKISGFGPKKIEKIKPYLIINP